MKVAVYNRFLQSMGGGERHSSMLAQVLADDGHEVDLVGHKDVGKEILADHLGLNLGKVNLRIVPERGEAQVARLSAEYELFVNASYMSRVRAQATRNLYLYEVVDVIGQGQYAYMEHLWKDTVLRMPEMFGLQGSFYVCAAGGGRWPQVINIWDIGTKGWKGWASNVDRSPAPH